MKYQTLKKGAVGGLLALMLVVSAAPVPQAHAATIEELQAQVQTLLAQLASLQGNMPAPASCNPFWSNLTLGHSGNEVSALQKFLIQRGHSIPAGATGYFGAQTQSALASFQASQGIAPAVGYFGPLTRARVQALCTPAPQTPAPQTPSTPSIPSTPTLRGEATLEKYEARSGDDTNLEEGQKNASVMQVRFSVDDGDARINRVDLAFTPDSTNNEQDPWDTFTEVALYADGDRLARIDASDEDNWEEDSPIDGSYRLRMTGLSWSLKDGDDAHMTVEVTMAKNIKGADDGEVWNIFVPTNGIRGVDRDKANVYTGDSEDMVSFDIDEAGSDDELIIKHSDTDPDSTTLELGSTRNSDWTTVFAFDIDTDDSARDIEIRKLPIQLTVGSSTAQTFVRDVRLVIDGTSYTKKTTTDGITNTVLFEFDKGDLVIDGGDRITAEVQVEFKALAEAYEGTTIVGNVDTSAIVARGADTLVNNQISGAATGETHAMRTSGAILTSKGGTALLRSNAGDTKEDDEGSYALKFDITAFDRDIFIPKSVDRGTALGTAGANFVIEDSSQGGAETASGTVAMVLASSADSQGAYFKVAEGDTESFTLMVEYNPEYQSFYHVQLYSVNWSTAASAPTAQQRAVPEQNFETAQLFIGN